MKRTAGLLTAGLGLVALLSGCTSAKTDTSPTPIAASTSAPSTVASTPVVSSSPMATAAPSGSVAPATQTMKPSSAKTDPSAPKGQCADSALKLDVRETGGGLGNRQDLIVFQNTGSTSCALAGAPGVSVVGGGNGTQLGKPAGRVPGSSTVKTLPPGESVTAELDRVYVDGKTTTFRTDNGPVACRPKHGDGYRIYPPHSYRAVFVKHDVWACTTDFVWMHVDPVVAGK